MDCYHDVSFDHCPIFLIALLIYKLQVVGNALVGVVFSRNAVSVVVLFALTPWIEGMGLRDLHILISVLAFVILLIPVPLIIWGKKARISSAKAYKKMALKQHTHRDVVRQ